MAKIHCINTSHPDFIKLSEDSGIDGLELDFLVADWQEARNTDEFPDSKNMKAPNGKPSKLFKDLQETSDNPIRAYLQVYSPQFMAWFGDWVNDPNNASRVVDGNGEPLVTYHTSQAKFEKFDKSFIGTGEGYNTEGKGFYFSTNKESVETYASLSALKKVKDKKQKEIESKELREERNRDKLRDRVIQLLQPLVDYNIKDKFTEEGHFDSNSFISAFVNNEFPIFKSDSWEEIKNTFNQYEEFNRNHSQSLVETLYTEDGYENEEFNNLEEAVAEFEQAREYKDTAMVYSTFLNIRNPISSEKIKIKHSLTTEEVDRDMYDGVVSEKENEEYYYIAFEPNQIKSVNNRGVFSKIDENIYYELASKPREDVDQKVKEELLGILNRNGITVTSMKEYEESYGLRTGKPLTVSALADTTRKIIAVDKNLENNKSLAEEAGHMVVASQVGTFAFNRAMRLVGNTDEFTQNYEKYKEAYSSQGLKGEALERKVRMEVLGKLMKEKVFNNISESTKGTGLAKYLRQMWDKFMSLFKKAVPELEQILDRWTNTFVSGKMGEPVGEGVFYEVEENAFNEGQALYEDIINGLRKRYRFFEKVGADIANLKELYWELYDMEYTKGMLRFLEFARQDIKRAIDISMPGFESGRFKPTSIDYRDFKLMLEYYDRSVAGIKHYFTSIMKEDGVFNEEQLEQVNALFKELVNDLHTVEIYHRKMGEKLGKKWAKEKIDEAIPDPEVAKAEKEVVDKTIRYVDYDSNRMLYWAGSLVHAKDPIQRALHFDVTNIRRSVDKFTYELGKGLVRKSKELGIEDISRLAEMDSQGRSTGYFKNEYKLGQFLAAEDKFHYDLHEEFGLPQDNHERAIIKRGWYASLDAIEDGTNVKPSDIENVGKLERYNQRIAEWYNTNTVPVPNWQDEVEKAKEALGGGTTEEFKQYKRDNIGIAKKGTKYEYEYPKGILTRPSDGRVKSKTYGDTTYTTKTVDWRNPEFAKLSPGEREYLDILIKVMEEADTKHHRKRNKYLMPQVKASTVDLLKAKKFGNIVENVKDLARTAEDDTEFGDTEKIERPDGSIANFVPIYFINKLDKMDNISLDLTSSVIAYADVMENYKQMSSALPTFEMVLDNIGHRLVKTDKKQYTGVESETYKSMEKFIEMNVLGKWKTPWIVGGINITKLMQGLVRFVTANNLAFSLYTTLASYFTSSVYSKIEDLVGQYTNQSNKIFAEKVWDTNIHQVLIESGKADKTSKLGLFFEQHHILKRNQDIFNNLDKSRLTRKALQSGMFWSYELVRLRVRGKLALAIADNYKYHNGKFYSTSQLKKMGVEVKGLKNYWDMMDIKDGKLVALHNDPSIEQIIERKTEYIGSNIDGELSYSDWAAAHQGAISQLVMTHRGWLARNIQLRLKPKNVNYITGEEESGFYLAFWDFMVKTFFGKERVTTLKGLLAKWETLSPSERHGVLRTIWEMAFIEAIAVLGLILNNIAADDDDDDSLIQYLSYQTNRVLLEVSAMNPTPLVVYDPIANDWAIRPPLLANVQELVAILNSPVAAARQVDDLMDIVNLFSDEKLKSGPYKGMTKRERLLIKMVPGLKGIYQARDPKSRNQYLLNKTLTWMKPE